MSWRRREAWVDARGARWRAEVDLAGLPLRAVLAEIPAQWDADAGWAPGPVSLDEAGVFAAQPTGPRRLELDREGVPIAEVWAHPDGGRRWIRSPPAVRAHRALHALRARGYAAPRPLGWIAPARGRGPSFSIHAPLPAPSVASRLRGSPPPAELRRLRVTGSALLRRMAADGLVHPGLGAERLRWADGELVLADLWALRAHRRGLAGLLAHLDRLGDDPALAAFSRWDRARFVWSALAGVADRRRWFRRVLMGTRSAALRAPLASGPSR